MLASLEDCTIPSMGVARRQLSYIVVFSSKVDLTIMNLNQPQLHATIILLD
jgi:hypothetical protein